MSHWLAGTRPRTPAPAYIAEALSRRLGRRISPADAGLGQVPDRDVPSVEDLPGGAALLRLVSADLDPVRRTALREQPFRSDWAVAPDWPEPAVTGCAPARRSLEGAVTAVELMTSAFAAAGEAFGGGHAHATLAAYLNTGVWAWLRSENPRSNEHPPLLGSAAVLTYLIAFTCFDNLHHNLAQRYYRVASRLAAEAGDLTAHLLVLRGMSTQASFLGYHHHALTLARTAVERIRRTVPRDVQASLLGSAAVAHAALGHRAEALAHLADAHRLTDDNDGGTCWRTGGGRSDVDYYTGRALAALSDHSRAEEALRDSLRRRPATHRRSRMLTTYHLADVQLQRGSPNAACATWSRFVLDYPNIQSARVKLLFDKFRDDLRPHVDNDSVRHVLRISQHLS
ncbi:tetratricopeptide repeat protein [Actinokineospora sp. G85]|uniref:tetratricopeptide repeat protein n=1 Tax=Actinokineospora sp. G85 TaxID=3406626 RepID=UPI003C783206